VAFSSSEGWSVRRLARVDSLALADQRLQALLSSTELIHELLIVGGVFRAAITSSSMVAVRVSPFSVTRLMR